MTTTDASGHGFTARDAVSQITELSDFDIALRQRTEGLTLAIWGIITAGIFLSYGYADAAITGAFPVWAMFIWAPWVVAGFLVVGALWESAALTSASAVEGGRSGWVHLAAWVGFIMLAWFGASMVGVRLAPHILYVFILGSAGIVLGATPFLAFSLIGRRIALVTGLIVLAGGFALSMSGMTGDAGDVAAALLVSITWITGGLYQTLRG